MGKNERLGKLFLEHYPVDENGVSNIALVDDLEKLDSDFRTHNGSTWARTDVSWLGKQYKIERKLKGGRTYSIQLIGFNVAPTNHAVPTEVRQFISGERCAVLDIGSRIEADHRDGTYSQDYYTIEDFQPLSKAVNDAKRQHCKVCKETGFRFDARVLGSNIGYTCGDAETKSCIGCYWNDTKEFWRLATKENI